MKSADVSGTIIKSSGSYVLVWDRGLSVVWIHLFKLLYFAKETISYFLVMNLQWPDSSHPTVDTHIHTCSNLWSEFLSSTSCCTSSTFLSSSFASSRPRLSILVFSLPRPTPAPRSPPATDKVRPPSPVAGFLCKTMAGQRSCVYTYSR